jgi:FKBP-type peptidyl-prolyl cis-trans isomerase FklB
MKHCLIVLLSVAIFVTQARSEDQPAAAKSEAPPALKNQKDKVSYSIGLEMGSGMKQQKLDVDPDLVLRGFRDGFSGAKRSMTEDEVKEVMEVFEKELEARMAKESQELPAKNKKEGDAFLAENKKKEGVKTLPSGLQYKIVREGTGATPKMDDKVSTHYRGTLIDGTEFDSSYSRKEPSSFTLRQVIKGWQEALQLMKVGSKWQLFIPSELAYADKGAGRTIGPNATLIFDIELLSIEKP